jgi:hypothetical protein
VSNNERIDIKRVDLFLKYRGENSNVRVEILIAEALTTHYFTANDQYVAGSRYSEVKNDVSTLERALPR